MTEALGPLVAISGMLGDERLWDAVRGELGALGTVTPTRVDEHSVPAMAAAVLAQSPARFALAGHSLGAIVALEMIRQAPERISRLALLSASGRGPSPAQQVAWSGWRQRTIDGQFEQVAGELAVATLARSRRGVAALVEANVGMALRVGPDGFLRQLAAQATRPDSLVSLRAIAVLVLVLSGADDEICPPHLQQELAERCRQAELVTIAGGGHMLPLECPGEVAEHLRRWLLAGRSATPG